MWFSTLVLGQWSPIPCHRCILLDKDLMQSVLEGEVWSYRHDTSTLWVCGPGGSIKSLWCKKKTKKKKLLIFKWHQTLIEVSVPWLSYNSGMGPKSWLKTQTQFWCGISHLNWFLSSQRWGRWGRLKGGWGDWQQELRAELLQLDGRLCWNRQGWSTVKSTVSVRFKRGRKKNWITI